MAGVHPFADSNMVKFLQKRLAELSGVKSEREVASDAGFTSLNVVNMMKKGSTRVPLDRVTRLAKALDCDASHLFRLALEQHIPADAPEAKFVNDVLSENERQIIAFVRDASGSSDPGLNDQRREAIAKTFG